MGSEAWLWGTGCSVDFLQPPLFWFFAAQGEVHTPQGPRRGTSARCGGWLPRGMPLTQFHYPHLLLLVVVLSCLVSAVHTPAWRVACSAHSADGSLVTCQPVSQPKAPSAQVMDFLFEKWKLYSDQCHHNLSRLPPPTGESHLQTPVSCHPA